MTVRSAASASAAACAVALAGCGLGARSETSDVGLTVTHDFGAHRVASVSQRHVPGSETVMRMLERSFRVGSTSGSVESIDGLSGTANRRDWFYYVNGSMTSLAAGKASVHPGDRIWWDLHDWLSRKQPDAVVGSYPDPFAHGIAGKRFPTTVECAPDVQEACRRVGAALGAIGVPVASQVLGGGGSGTDSIAVLVGTWQDLRQYGAGVFIADGPASSGIYAKFSGGSLELLGPDGRVTQTLGAGAGLVAATGQPGSAPTWLISGTDSAGVMAAASSLNRRSLENRFAVAIQGRRLLAVPQ